MFMAKLVYYQRDFSSFEVCNCERYQLGGKELLRKETLGLTGSFQSLA